MSLRYQRVTERIRSELADLERMVNRALRTWEDARQQLDHQDVFLDSVALNLHGFYSGAERLFELVDRHVDQSGRGIEGDAWHSNLLERMRQETKERPAVLGDQSAAELDRLRRFRHLVRHTYAFRLDPEKMEPLVSSLADLWSTIRAELLAFADFLEDVAVSADD